ncbi:Hypothetical protein NCS54_00132500 [Fusarium falciforme]|uniref:Hypothetical protein n=1 Tax=Fusarium falciforme TaxID=195108 RepID=UPI0023001DFC|nr:Hypothetical protein NCS54_00132500 [Fusarium falciforme]WAO84119.1 Hypothetical protein NCS54_00132500 [Fusarium falciforme]
METAASIVAFVQVGTEIAKCVIKTKKLWDQAQELPEDIQALIMRLQCYQPIFDAMQQQLQHDDSLCSVQNDSLVQTNLDCCKMSLKNLQSTSDDLLSQLNAKKGLKRKLAAVKLALGKDNLDRLKNRLSESIELLKLAIMAWDMAVAKRTRDLVFSRVTTEAYIQWPSWLSQSVCEIQSSPTLGGWTYNYRMYNIISSKSEIIKRIKVGDKDGVLELFNSRKASPFDKDDEGNSLLYYAADNKRFDLCQLFLSLGLQNALLDRVGELKESPLTPLVFNPDRHNPEVDWVKITDLFYSYLDEPETNMILRLFDCGREWAYGDEFAMVFRQRFLPKFYTGPLRHRLEAFRLGSFHMDSAGSLNRLLAQDRQITGFDVNQSSHEKLSLVHSAAVAMSIRFADEAIPQRRGAAQWPIYSDGWSSLVREVASVASADDLHVVETVRPWDVYHVPVWKGTPLISVLGGALCYISPDISFFYWDSVFQQAIQEWALNLQESGVDLVKYGEREVQVVREQLRGALDAEAIESSRNSIRDVLPMSCKTTRVRLRDGLWNQNHWVPIRLLEIETGPTPSDWRVIWAPEFEWMACQFWELVEKEDIVMPGSWVDV